MCECLYYILIKLSAINIVDYLYLHGHAFQKQQKIEIKCEVFLVV